MIDCFMWMLNPPFYCVMLPPAGEHAHTHTPLSLASSFGLLYFMNSTKKEIQHVHVNIVYLFIVCAFFNIFVQVLSEGFEQTHLKTLPLIKPVYTEWNCGRCQLFVKTPSMCVWLCR